MDNITELEARLDMVLEELALATKQADALPDDLGKPIVDWLLCARVSVARGHQRILNHQASRH